VLGPEKVETDLPTCRGVPNGDKSGTKLRVVPLLDLHKALRQPETQDYLVAMSV
jgi:hypothetical protein